MQAYNLFNDISKLVADNKTAAEIATTLRDSGITRKPINRANLVHLLNLRNMLTKIVSNNSDEKWTGTVLTMQDTVLSVGTEEQKLAIRWWFSHVTNVTNTIWDTTNIQFAKPFWELVKTFADQPGMPSTEDFQAVADLGGGWKFSGVTTEQVQEVIDKQAKVKEIETAVTAEQAAQKPHVVATQRLQSLNVDDYTDAELTAEIATIRAYPETWPVEGE